MARKMTEWPSKRGPITKIMPSDGCIGDTVPLAVGKWYDFHEFGWYMGNVGLTLDAFKAAFWMPTQLRELLLRAWRHNFARGNARCLRDGLFCGCEDIRDILPRGFHRLWDTTAMTLAPRAQPCESFYSDAAA